MFAYPAVNPFQWQGFAETYLLVNKKKRWVKPMFSGVNRVGDTAAVFDGSTVKPKSSLGLSNRYRY